MTRTLRRYQLPHPDQDGNIVLDLPKVAWALCVEEIASTPYLVAIVDEDTPLEPVLVVARRANQEAPCHPGEPWAGLPNLGVDPVPAQPFPYFFLGAIGIHYFFWKGTHQVGATEPEKAGT